MVLRLHDINDEKNPLDSLQFFAYWVLNQRGSKQWSPQFNQDVYVMSFWDFIRGIYDEITIFDLPANRKKHPSTNWFEITEKGMVFHDYFFLGRQGYFLTLLWRLSDMSRDDVERFCVDKSWQDIEFHQLDHDIMYIPYPRKIAPRVDLLTPDALEAIKDVSNISSVYRDIPSPYSKEKPIFYEGQSREEVRDIVSRKKMSRFEDYWKDIPPWNGLHSINKSNALNTFKDLIYTIDIGQYIFTSAPLNMGDFFKYHKKTLELAVGQCITNIKEKIKEYEEDYNGNVDPEILIKIELDNIAPLMQRLDEIIKNENVRIDVDESFATFIAYKLRYL